MNGRWVLAAAFALSVGVVACGGGGGGGNPNPPVPAPGTPTPVSSATPTPTASPTPIATATPPVVQATCNPAPAVPAIPTPSGNYEFTGTLKQQATYFYPATVTPTTSPTAPPTCVVESVAAVFAGTSAVDPSGKGGSNLHENELDASPLSTTSVGSDVWTLGGAQTTLTATQVVSPNNGSPTSTTLQEFTTPPVIGQASLGTFGTGNSDAGTLNQSTSYGLSYSRTINADGSYSESGTTQTGTGGSGGTIFISEAANGSGTITGPANGGFAPKTFSAPSAGKITLTVNPGANQTTKLIPVWWTTLTLYSENNSITAVTSEPSPCTGTAAYKAERIVTQIDTIMGYTETTTYDTYDTQSGNGADCVAYSDTINNYYDWSGDIFLANRFSSNGAAYPLSTFVTTETLALAPGQAGNRPFDASRGRRVSAASVSAAAAAHFTAIVAQTRARILAHALRLHTTNSVGGI